MFLDEEIGFGWCISCTWRCTPAEAIGIWSVMLFYITVLLVTVIHGVIQYESGTSGRNTEATRMQLAASTKNDLGGECAIICWLLVYFFSFAAGCLLWALGGTRWVHPVQAWQVQTIGAVMLVACVFLFVAVHINMGENWSPEPEQKLRHRLVKDGLFRWARHPMYAVFLWATLGTFLATLNWLITWCVSGTVIIGLRRIETEERILVGLFEEEYLEYRTHVSALGPPWCCLGGFDRRMGASQAQSIHGSFRPVLEVETI